MDHGTVIAVFVVIAAIALAMQATVWLLLYLIARRVHRDVSKVGADVKRQVDLVLHEAVEILAASREPIRTITANAVEISRIATERAGKLDGAIEDFTDRLRVQLVRIDRMVADLSDKLEETAGVVQRGILNPLREFSAIIRGIQSGLDFLFARRHHANVREATQDEEMFI